MKIFKELEKLNFFEWLDKEHNLKDTDMSPEYLDKLPLENIHRTVANSMVFRYFRERGYDVKVQKESHNFYFGFYWTGAAWIIVGSGTYERVESDCLIKLIEITKFK